MKGELININNQLSFFVKRKDIQTEADKKAICRFIECLYHTYASSWFTMDNKDLEDALVQGKKYAYVGFRMSDDNYESNVVYQFLTKEKFDELKLITGILSDLEEIK